MDKNHNKAGVIWIVFKEDVSDEVIQGLITTIYAENKEKIQGMQFNQITDAKTMKQGKSLVDNYWKEGYYGSKNNKTN